MVSTKSKIAFLLCTCVNLSERDFSMSETRGLEPKRRHNSNVWNSMPLCLTGVYGGKQILENSKKWRLWSLFLNLC